MKPALILHGDDDPYCPLEQTRWLAAQLDAEMHVVPGGHHLGAKYAELPEIWDLIKPRVG
jgi:pimeloyl-ACP methyl ester carboxylesterase